MTFSSKTVLTLCAALLLAACGGDNAETREAKMEKEAKKHGIDADVSLDDDGNVETVEIKTGSGTVGRNLNLPDGFPSDVVLADSWQIMSVAPAAGGYMVQALSSDSVDAVVSEIRSSFTDNGWTEVAFEQTAPNMSRIGFEKDDRMTNANIINSGGPQLAVQILTMKKPG